MFTKMRDKFTWTIVFFSFLTNLYYYRRKRIINTRASLSFCTSLVSEIKGRYSLACKEILILISNSHTLSLSIHFLNQRRSQKISTNTTSAQVSSFKSSTSLIERRAQPIRPCPIKKIIIIRCENRRASLFIEALIFTAREELEEERRGNDVLKRQNETLKETLGDIRRQMSMLGKYI